MSKKAVARLLSLLDLEDLDVNLFRGRSPDDSWQRVYGGQVIGQALVAASRTVEGRLCHSLHAYFLRPGDPKIPILYQVERTRDGRSFTTRHVNATQKGKQIFHMSVSFQIEEEGLSHYAPMPEVVGPDSIMRETDRRREIMDKLPEQVRTYFVRERPIELRLVNPSDFLKPKATREPQYVWLRASDTMPEAETLHGRNLHMCVLAYASDMTLLDTALSPTGVSWMRPDMQMASLDHAIWFHRPFRADDWMLYAQDAPSASGARGFARGLVYAKDGTLVASVAQEGLIRLRGKK